MPGRFIKLSTIHSFKGLEAQTVFCILTPDDEAEMVYTGITRAQRNLVVFDTSTSNFRTFFQAHMAVVGASFPKMQTTQQKQNSKLSKEQALY